jgi:hypothetical protein
MYQHTKMTKTVERVQTGVRLERRTLKVLKALAERLNLTLGDLLEGIVLHAFEGKTPFGADTLRDIKQLKSVYELDLTAADAHKLKDKSDADSRPARARRPLPRA